MKIFQTTPRLVFLSGSVVYKFFNSKEECQEEIKLIKSTPLTTQYDEISSFTMNFIDIIDEGNSYYTMKLAKGKQLSNHSDLNDYKLAGNYLRCFHRKTLDKESKKVFLFGDFSRGHIYIDHNNKSITTIDPGTGFGVIDFPEYDIARFIVDLFQSHNVNIFNLYKQIIAFLNGYGHIELNYDRLISAIEFRINRNYKKRIKLGVRLRKYLSAFYWYISSKLKFLYIKNKLKKEIK